MDPQAAQMQAYARRISEIEAEIDRLNEAKRETYAEAKACGFDKHIIRQIAGKRP